MNEEMEQMDESQQSAEPAPASIVILAIGASGENADHIAAVLAELPWSMSFTAVLALKNREALDETRLRNALGDRADMLATVNDGDPIEPDHIYLPPPQ